MDTTHRWSWVSVWVAAAGLAMVIGAVSWALPGYWALGLFGVALVLLGVGARAAWGAIVEGVLGASEPPEEPE